MPINHRIYDLHTEEQRQGAPEFCPFTGLQFWGHISHPDKGLVPTYGGPFDTYTIPEQDEDDEWRSERFDHDAGDWVDGGAPWDATDIDVPITLETALTKAESSHER